MKFAAILVLCGAIFGILFWIRLRQREKSPAFETGADVSHTVRGAFKQVTNPRIFIC